jgi:hypothetical protein
MILKYLSCVCIVYCQLCNGERWDDRCLLAGVISRTPRNYRSARALWGACGSCTSCVNVHFALSHASSFPEHFQCINIWYFRSRYIDTNVDFPSKEAERTGRTVVVSLPSSPSILLTSWKSCICSSLASSKPDANVLCLSMIVVYHTPLSSQDSSLVRLNEASAGLSRACMIKIGLQQ